MSGSGFVGSAASPSISRGSSCGRALLVAAALVLASAGRVVAEDRASLSALVERFDHLTVGKPLLVGPMTLSSGHLECKLQSGNAAPVLAGDDVVGVYFEGAGLMEYLSVDPVEAPSVMFNARKGSSLKPEKTDKGVRLRDNFTRILWLVQGQPVPALSGQPGSPLTAGFAGQREKFRRISAAPLSYDFAIQKLNSPETALVRAELDGGAEALVYELGGTLNPSEGLAAVRSSESDDPEMRKLLFRVTLSHQPVGWDARDVPRPRVVLTDVDVDLKASAGSDAALTVVETLLPMDRALGALWLNLESTVYTTFGRNLSKRSERLRKVTDEAGRSLVFVHDWDQALVQLAEPAAPGRPIKLKFDIDGDFLVQPGGDSYWELGVRDWFPQPALIGQFYTFHANVRVKKPFVPFAPGKTIRRATEGDENLLETRIDRPICFAVILAGRYDFAEEERNGVTIRVATYALKNERAVKQLTNLAGNIIQYYQEFLGPFPLPELNIIEISSYGFGQAPPGTMFITREAFNPLIGEENQLYSEGINERFAHEIAHQYWGTAVKMPTHEEQWITESFAEYCAGLFLKVYKNEATFRKLAKHWRTRPNWATDAAPIPLANRAWVSDDATSRFAIRTGLLYNKGPVLLGALHKELGDETFFTFLKSYQKSFAWKFGSTKTLAGLLQFMTKKDYMPFFEKYYWGIEMPKD
jgi:hypothetical protein